MKLSYLDTLKNDYRIQNGSEQKPGKNTASTLLHRQLTEDCLAYAKIYNQYGINIMNMMTSGGSGHQNQLPQGSQNLLSHEKPLKLFHLIVAMLQDFQEVDDRIPQLIGLTFNNISCCCKRQGQIERAEVNLKKALVY